MKRIEMLKIIGEVLDRLETTPQPACFWGDFTSTNTATGSSSSSHCKDCSDHPMMRYQATCNDQPMMRYQATCNDCPSDMPTVKYAVLD